MWVTLYREGYTGFYLRWFADKTERHTRAKRMAEILQCRWHEESDE